MKLIKIKEKQKKYNECGDEKEQMKWRGTMPQRKEKRQNEKRKEKEKNDENVITNKN